MERCLVLQAHFTKDSYFQLPDELKPCLSKPLVSERSKVPTPP
jgi:hypothetical protein